MHENKPELSVVIPAYNEESRLGQTLAPMWRALNRRFSSFEMIVVDDGSSDDTAGVVERFAAGHPQVRLLRCAVNRGKGHAVRRGVLASRGCYVLFCDADQSTPMREVRKLLKGLEAHDVAIGSRAIRQARIVECQPFYRVLMGKVFNKIVQLAAVPGILDTQCGFKCFRGDRGRDLFSRCRIDGFSFDVELLFVARSLQLSVVEIGVLWKNNPESKVHPVRHSLQMLRDLVRIRCYGLLGHYPPIGALRVRTEA